MKKDKNRDLFLEQIRKVPIVQVACEKVGLSRNTIYRWRQDDPEFKKQLEEALAEGEALVNDMSESQLLSLIREKNWSAISFWLRHRNPKFRERLEVTAKLQTPHEELTEEQATVVQEALRLASIIPEDPSNPVNPAEQALDEHDQTPNQPGASDKAPVQPPASGTRGNDDQGS